MNNAQYQNELFSIVSSLPSEQQTRFMLMYTQSQKNPVLIFGFSVWLGCLGIDRFVVGDIVAGVLKLVTFGGLGIWQIVDWFLIGSRTRSKNIQLARQLKDSLGGAAPAVAAPADGED